MSDETTDEKVDELEVADTEQKVEEKPAEPEEIKVEPKKGMTVYDTEASEVLDPNKYAQIKVIAADLFASQSLPQGYDNKFKVMAAIQMGAELGLQPFEAINSLYVVNGSFSLWGKATIKQVKKHGWHISYSDETNEQCTATVTKGDESYSETFLFQDAVKSGYTQGKSGLKFGWKEGINRKLKMRYGALSILIKTYIPEVLGAAMGIAEIDIEASTPKVLLSEDDVARVINEINHLETLESLKEYFMALDKDYIKEKRIVSAKDKKKLELSEVKNGEGLSDNS